ncbi:MAG: TolB family protein, partial [Mycobacterium sp.]
SADGRWVAFGAGTRNRPTSLDFPDVDEVWVVDIETDDIRRLSGLSVSDIEWAPDATELFIATDGGIVVYSVASDETRPLGDASGVKFFAMSPDGRTIAFERPHPGLPDYVHNLWLMDADGTGERILAATFGTGFGIGPVWSPDGEHIVYQQLCDRCREETEVVVVTVGDNDPLEPAGTQVIIPPPETTGPDGPTTWYIDSVTWSPDGTTLLVLGDGVFAMRVDGETPPVVLYDRSGSPRLGDPAYSGYPWLPFQSWSRAP